METNKKAEIKLNAVIIGIRYQRLWRILDIGGSVVDTILKNKNSPFILDTDYFTKVGEEEKGMALMNPNTNCILRINIDDLIYKHVFDNSAGKGAKKSLNWFFNSIKKFLIPKIILDFKIQQIRRVGIVYNYYIDSKHISKEYISRVTENNSGEITKFNLDFHKKFPAEIALAKKEINDYKNIIYSIKHKETGDDKEKEDKKYEISLDYQYYFEPYTDHLEGWNIGKFLDSSQAYLNNKFYPWLKKRFKNLEIKSE